MSELKGFNVQRMRELSNKMNRVVASLVDYEQVSPQVARIAVTLSTCQASQTDCATAIATALKNKAYPVLASFREMASSGLPVLAGFVRLNSEVLTEDDARTKNFRQVTASMLMDPSDDSTWQIKEEGGSVMFVRADAEDLRTVLAMAKQRTVGTPSLAKVTASADGSVQGEFAAFVTSEGDLKHGFVLASDGENVELLTEDSEVPVVTSENCVIEAAFVQDELRVEMAAVGIDDRNFDSKSKEAMKEYYGRVFSYAPDYAAKLKGIIDATAAV